LKFGFSDFLRGSFPALGGSKHGFLGVIARGMQAYGGDCVCSKQNTTRNEKAPPKRGKRF
jgi:hypothetical protein